MIIKPEMLDCYFSSISLLCKHYGLHDYPYIHMYYQRFHYERNSAIVGNNIIALQSNIDFLPVNNDCNFILNDVYLKSSDYNSICERIDDNLSRNLPVLAVYEFINCHWTKYYGDPQISVPGEHVHVFSIDEIRGDMYICNDPLFAVSNIEIKKNEICKGAILFRFLDLVNEKKHLADIFRLMRYFVGDSDISTIVGQGKMFYEDISTMNIEQQVQNYTDLSALPLMLKVKNYSKYRYCYLKMVEYIERSYSIELVSLREKLMELSVKWDYLMLILLKSFIKKEVDKSEIARRILDDVINLEIFCVETLQRLQ